MTRPFKSAAGMGQLSFACAHFELPHTGDLQNKRYTNLRGHWSVENSLHWSMDVTFGEDRSRIRLGNGPDIAAVFRRLALTVLKQDTTVKKTSIRGKRLQPGWNNDVLESILTGIPAN